jgi:TorA maturation chaperone TorD
VTDRLTGPQAGRWELLRAVGAVADSPAGALTASRALGLPVPTAADHTGMFVLNCPPYAAIYLGPDGGLGGEGADRVAGFWRAIGLMPPAEPDHLAALLGLYAALGEAAAQAGRPATAEALARSGAALFWEHLWPWLPAYLGAAADLAGNPLAGWARLAGQVIDAEYRGLRPPGRLPLGLSQAPAPARQEMGLAGLIAMLTTPVRSGFVLTRSRLAAGAAQAGVGHRIGERSFALRAMLEQDPAATLGWLSREAGRSAGRHAARHDPASQWWATRAAGTAVLLQGLGEQAGALQAGPALA